MNTKFQCYILDDEPLAIKVIEQHLSRFEQFEICGSSTEPLEAHRQLKTLQPDLLFLDIEMPEINGLEFIDSMQSQPKIIITTAYREYAVEGFELNVLDYLVKPIPFPRFVKALDKFLDFQKPKTTQINNNTFTSITIKANRKNIRIELSDILYIEGVKDYVKIVLPNQSFLTKYSIRNFHKTLPLDQFLRIHKSFIVAKNKVTAFTSHDVEIGQIELPIGRQFKEAFLSEMK